MKIRTIISKTLSAVGIKRNRTIIPKISPEELLHIINVEPVEKEADNGNVTLKELTILSQLVNDDKFRAIFEIGTFNGRTTINLARFSPEDAKVYTLDLPQKDLDTTKFSIDPGDRAYVEKSAIGERYQKNNAKIIQLYGDSATFDFKPYYGAMDFVFIDGAHSAPYVVNDTEAAFKMIKTGGIIVWHDYGVWKDVIKVINTYYRKDERFKDLKHINGTCLVYYKRTKISVVR